MNAPTDPSFRIDAAAVAAALEWWREAGIDFAYSDEGESLLDVAEPAPAGDKPSEMPGQTGPALPVAAEPRVQMGGARESWPTDLEQFAGWWLEEKSLAPPGTHPRVPPRGPAGAQLMIVVPEPEEGDSDTLLAGPQGRLLASMLKAMAIPAEEIYLAAALPRHLPLPDWDALGKEGLGEVLAHHISLVAPKRLLVLGSSILPLLGHGAAHAPADLREFNHEGARVPALAGPDLQTLLLRAGERARLWQRWLAWTEQ